MADLVQVNDVVDWVFKINVVKMYCDPYYWTNDIDRFGLGVGVETKSYLANRS